MLYIRAGVPNLNPKFAFDTFIFKHRKENNTEEELIAKWCESNPSFTREHFKILIQEYYDTGLVVIEDGILKINL